MTDLAALDDYISNAERARNEAVRELTVSLRYMDRMVLSAAMCLNAMTDEAWADFKNELRAERQILDDAVVRFVTARAALDEFHREADRFLT